MQAKVSNKGKRRTNRYSHAELVAIQEAATRLGLVDGNPIAKFTRLATIKAVKSAGVEWPERQQA